MKLALGFILRNEIQFLPRILGLIGDRFDGVLADDYGSTDGTLEVLREAGVHFQGMEWRNYAAARQDLYDRATGLGYDYVLQLDGDEVIWPHDVSVLRQVGKMAGALRRINLLPGGRWQAHSYPDWQVRLFECGREDLRWDNAVHEVPMSGSLPVFLTGKCECLPLSIYHYSLLKPAGYVWLKEQNYARMKRGEPVDWGLPVPEDVREVVDPKGVPFIGELPI